MKKFLAAVAFFPAVAAAGWTTDGSALRSTGAVAIGTGSAAAGFQMTVDGPILGEELIVKNSANWPDFVFAETDLLRPLFSVERFVRAERHLPWVPPASELGGGVPAGATVRAVLEATERAARYLFDQDRRLRELRARVADLEKTLAAR